MKFEYLLLIKSNCKEKMQMNNNIQKEIIKFKQIDAFKSLSTSPNAKTIITDGKTPLIGLPTDGK